MKNKTDALVAPIVNQDRTLAVVVGIVSHDQSSFFCYGHPFPQTDAAATPDTIFEIASASKVFTTTLLAQMVENGLVELDEPVGNLLPEVKHLSTKITLLSLATHTSGLPAMPSNLLWHTVRNPKNPYAAYSDKDLFQFLNSYKTQSTPIPAPYSYSNVGYAVLSHALANRLGQTFEMAIETKVCQPLGLKDTAFRLKSEQRQRLAPGFSSPGRSTSNWELGALEGAGGLLSSARDVVHFIQAHLGVVGGLTERVRTLSHTPKARITPKSQIALGWTVDEIDSGTAQICWKDGAAAGYRSFLGFNQEKEFGVVVLTNLGFSLLDLILPWRKQVTAEDIGLRILAEADSL